MIELLSIKEASLGFVAHRADIVGCQNRGTAARAVVVVVIGIVGSGVATSILWLLLCPFFLPLLQKGLLGQVMPGKELLQLLIATLQHFNDLRISPMIHGDMSYRRSLHA